MTASVVTGDKSGFAYADDISLSSLKRSSAIAQSILLHGGEFEPELKKIEQAKTLPQTRQFYYPSINPLDSLSDG